MEKYSQCMQMLIITSISLFLIINIMPITNGLPVAEKKTVETRNSSDLIHVSGTMGQNGWYISNVQITIHPPQGAGPVFYSFDNMTWSEYVTPIIVNSDGFMTVYCFYMEDGNQSEIYRASFKIDKTPPFVTITFHRDGCRVLVSVDAIDNMSGVVSVEFYSDGALIGTLTVEPYDFEFYVGLFGEHTMSVIVYDAAGNSVDAFHTFPYELGHKQNNLHQQMFRLFQNLIEITMYRLFV
ncbi:MAG TPA: hypothetical protein HA258_04170 [Thermoplasmata archaeon]|nr:hypothetical protein [Thermoplasmata archaeon]